jgi:hypothetical protein
MYVHVKFLKANAQNLWFIRSTLYRFHTSAPLHIAPPFVHESSAGISERENIWQPAFHRFPAAADYGYSALPPPAETEYGMLPSDLL